MDLTGGQVPHLSAKAASQRPVRESNPLHPVDGRAAIQSRHGTERRLTPRMQQRETRQWEYPELNLGTSRLSGERSTAEPYSRRV